MNISIFTKISWTRLKHLFTLSRDALNFRKFIESTYFSKDREDPYTHFYLKESETKEKIQKMMA